MWLEEEPVTTPVRNALRPLLILLLTPLLLVPMGAPALAQGARRTPESCASTLDCTNEELDAMPLTERLVFVREVQDKIAASYIPGFRHWRNIEGIIRAFIDEGLGAPGSWISRVDSGILEGLERGSAIALGISSDEYGNPGSKLWADYLRRLHRGELRDRWVHDPAWGNAEQASTEHGVRIAEDHGVYASRVDWNIYEYSEMYRWMLRNPQPALFILNQHMRDATGVPLVPADFQRWFTDVTISTPAYRGGHLAYDLSAPSPAGAPVSATQLLLAYLPELTRSYQQEVSQAD